MKADSGGPNHAIPSSVQMRRERSSQGLIAGLAFCIGVVVCLVALVAQRIPANTQAHGVLWPVGGISRLGVGRDGVVERVMVRAGDLVTERQPIMVVRHRLVPAQEVRAMELREKMLKSRLDNVQSEIESVQESANGEHLTSMIRLEDELSESLVELRDKLSLLQRESSTALYAPRAGQVVELRTYVGAEVGRSQALAAIIDRAPVYQVRVYVNAETASRLALSMPARVNIGPSSKAVTQLLGTIVGISSLPVSPADVDRSVVIAEPMYEVDISLDRTTDALDRVPQAAPGMPVSVSFELETRTLFDGMIGRFATR